LPQNADTIIKQTPFLDSKHPRFVLDYAAARATMIDSQVRTNDVSDLALQDAVRVVPREVFVPDAKRSFAYAEIEIQSAPGRVLWKSRDFTKLAQAAGAFPGDKVLVIAGAAGYSAAVFAAMGASVAILEESEALAAHAKAVLAASDVLGVAVAVGDLQQGLPGPFDLIFVDGAVEAVSPKWTNALSEGGRLAVVVSEGPVGKARLYVSSGGVASARDIFDCNVPLLAGFAQVRGFEF
jgi:protein-L-isoaspartate(D-aspartate) O-methyltransferase